LEINALGDSTHHELDDRGNRIKTINAIGDSTHYFYDSSGLLTKTINALGDSVVYFHDNRGLLDSTTNELGYVTRYEYDLAGNQIAIIDPLGNRTEYEYDDNGRMILIRDPLGRETEYVYDNGSDSKRGCCGSEGSGNLLMAIVNPAGDSTIFEYDKMGNQTKVIDALGNETITEYDGEGCVTKTIDPVGRWVSYEYDVLGNLASRTDSLGRTTNYEYDSRNRQVIVTDALDHDTEFLYDGTGNMTHLINANGDTTFFAYDLLSQKTSEADPLGNAEYFYYNPLGLVDSSITPNGDKIVYTYDELSRLTLQQFPEDSLVYQYDAMSRQLQIDDADSRLVFAYANNGKLETVTTGNGGNPDDIQPITTMEYVYDSAGQKTAMIDPSGDSTKYYYSIIGTLDSLIDPSGGTFEFERDALGRTTRLTRPNGTTTDYSYNSSSKILSILHKNGSTIIDSLAYTYNGVGNVSMMTDEADTAEYGYDSLDQVVMAEYTNPSLPTESYEYDPLGNRITSHISSSYTHNEANQLIEDDQNTYSYDNNGNMIAKVDKSTSDSTEYIYNYRNRLIGVNEYAGGAALSMQADYSYDGLERRINKYVDGDTTLYIYDASNFIGEYDGGQALIATYTNGPGIDRPLKVTRGGTGYYFYEDKLGTIRTLTDNLGDVAQAYEYDAFGNIKSALSSSYFSPYTYTGREWDEGSGSYYYRARYYSAQIGQFMSEDPNGFNALDYNLYRYVGNTPTNATDPFGLYSTNSSSSKSTSSCCREICDGTRGCWWECDEPLPPKKDPKDCYSEVYEPCMKDCPMSALGDPVCVAKCLLEHLRDEDARAECVVSCHQGGCYDVCTTKFVKCVHGGS
jgi:RHS repeat-associated protein